MSERGVAAREAALRRRTQLFVPANKPSFVTHAASSGADAVVVDLEDSVPAAERDRARGALAQMTEALRAARPALHLVVRVNSGPTLAADVEAAVAAGVDGVLLPKVESAAQVLLADELAGDAEARHGRVQGAVELQLLIESSRGLLAAAETARAAARVVALMVGVEDLSAELEIDPASPDFDINWAHGMVLCAAKAHGLAAYGLMGSLANYGDPAALSSDARRSRAFGYTGALCIHPAQVRALNDAFSPTPQEVEEAHAVLSALAKAEAEGTASVGRGGRMIDAPAALRARRLLARADRAT